MASQLDGRAWSEAEMPAARRPTSHRRKPARKRRGLRRSAITAVVSGLAVTAPLMLRAHGDNEVALAPDNSVPTTSTPTTTAGKAPASPPAPSTDLAIVTSSRSLPPVSRDATRSATSDLPAPVAGAGVPTVQISSAQAASYEAEVVALTNAQRAAHGCPALRDD